MSMASSADFSELLWTDTSVFTARFKKSAAALVALQQALERHRPLDGREQEFFDLYDGVFSADPAAFGRVWTDPRAYQWVRVAYELLKSCLSGADISPLVRKYVSAVRCAEPHEALAWHLEQFKMFALAVALRDGECLTFERPWEPLLPMAIPATSWSLSGSAPLMIHALCHQSLHVTTAGGESLIVPLDEKLCFDSPELARHCCPVIEHAGCRLLAQPHAFHVPTLGAVAEVVGAGVGFQWQHEPLLRRTLQSIQRHDPQTFDQFRNAMSVVALKPRDCGDTFNTSHSQLPGAFTASAVNNPLTLADDFIHEFYHNRLFAIEERGPFFDPQAESAFTAAKYYSPWRCDPRPLHGVLHGWYVFSRVCRYWLRVYDDPLLDDADHQYAVDRLLRIPVQLSMAAHVLRNHATFTPFGRSLLKAMVNELSGLLRDVADAHLPNDAPALAIELDGSYAVQLSEIDRRPLTVLEALDEHRQLYDLDLHCADIELPRTDLAVAC